MLLLAALALTALTAALALPTMGMTNQADNQMNKQAMWKPPSMPCCLPDRWGGAMYDLNDDQNFLRYVTRFAADGVNLIEVTDTEDRIAGVSVQRTYSDFKKNVTYTIVNGKCMASPIKNKFYNTCNAPRNATSMSARANITVMNYLGNGTLGGSLQFDAWNLQYHDGLNLTIQLARTTCLPIIEKVQKASAFNNDILLFDNAMINPPSKYFDFPAECATSAGVVG